MEEGGKEQHIFLKPSLTKLVLDCHMEGCSNVTPEHKQS